MNKLGVARLHATASEVSPNPFLPRRPRILWSDNIEYFRLEQ
jgi:hypothetical protein